AVQECQPSQMVPRISSKPAFDRRRVRPTGSRAGFTAALSDPGRSKPAEYHSDVTRMSLLMIPRLALKALAQNKLRTGLTMLGIVIGVGAVICVVAIGEGASANVERAITNIGANMVWVEAGGVNRNGVRTGSGATKTLTLGDYEAIKEQILLVANVTPQADTRVQVVYGNQNWATPVRGVGPEYLALKNWNVVRGGMYTE